MTPLPTPTLPPAAPVNTKPRWLPSSTAMRRAGWATALVALLGAAAAALYMPTNEALAQRAAEALTQAAGVPVRVGALDWHVLPRPAVVLTDVVAGDDPAAPAVTVSRALLVPEVSWDTIRSRKLRLLRAKIDGAVVQQRALAGLGGAAGSKGSNPSDPTAAATAGAAPPLKELVAERVTWVSRHGIAVVVSGSAVFDAGWRPRTVTAQLPDAKVPADATLTRQGTDDRWALDSRLGGGTASGDLVLTTSATAWSVGGTLALNAIGVADAMQALNRRSIVSGLARGSTVVSAHSTFDEGPGQLAKSLRTDTRFTMGPSQLLRFDLAKAIRTLGSDTDGQTPLERISGTMSTRNAADGMVIEFADVKAESGALSAVGRGRLVNRQVSAEVSVDLVDGLVGVPLRITGPVNAVKVSVAPGAVAGAAVGTAVLPGVGTALGARLGAALGKLFGRDGAAPAPAPAPRKP